MEWQLAFNFLIASVAIINPIGKVPVWEEAAAGERSGVRWRLALLVTLTGGAILHIFLLFGMPILKFFGIDLAAFRVGGGIVILLTGIRMLQGVAIQIDHDSDDDAQTQFALAKVRFRQIVVPMVVPFTAGPGSISTMILYGSRVDGLVNYILVSVMLLLVMLSVLLVLLAGAKIRYVLGDLTLSVFTRLFGLILAAIAAQLILEGLGEAFPALLGNTSPLVNDLNGNGR